MSDADDALGPLGRLDVTYRRYRSGADDATFEQLNIWIGAQHVGGATVHIGAETELIDLLVYALAGNGAREREG